MHTKIHADIYLNLMLKTNHLKSWAGPESACESASLRVPESAFAPIIYIKIHAEIFAKCILKYMLNYMLTYTLKYMLQCIPEYTTQMHTQKHDKEYA